MSKGYIVIAVLVALCLLVGLIAVLRAMIAAIAWMMVGWWGLC